MGLTYEIAAGRVLAPFFGTSLLTWTTVIAVVLAGFSLGSALGGFIAERPRAQALRLTRAALVASAVLMAVSPTLLGLVHSIGARGTAGMFFAVVLVFFPASVCITLPSPLLAKCAVEARPGREGSSLGLVLAAGSVGAIFGAILAGFVTLPLIGSTATFAACGAVALLCLLGLRGGDPGNPAVTIAATGFVAFAGIAGTPVCQYESGLSCLHIVYADGEVRLYSDGTTQAAEPTVRSAPQMALSYTDWIWSRMDRDLGPSPHVLFIGGGGYTLPTALIDSRPLARATAVEIDPLITQVTTESLPRAGAIIETSDRLDIIHADGRVFLNETSGRFDAAVMDAFSSGSVPAHLATVETFTHLRAITDGPLYVNLIDRPDGGLARGVHAILGDLYPHIRAVQGPPSPRGRSNIILMASDRPITPLDRLPDDYAAARISPGRAFTDDRGWIGHR